MIRFSCLVSRFLSVVAVLLLMADLQGAPLALPHVFTDNMVLQTGLPVPVWGTAEAGEAVTVEFAGQKVAATADATGRWRVKLAPLAVNAAPAELLVTAGAAAVHVQNVLVGEVWLCSGQSNMEKPVGEQKGQKPTLNAVEEIAAANFPLIRMFKVPKFVSPTPGADVEAKWEVCTPVTLDAVKFSAVGYFFARRLHEELKVPVGVIDSSWGGTQIEPWTVPANFAASPALVEQERAYKAMGIKTTKVGSLYGAMIQPLVPYALRGVLWYQGESNLSYGDEGSIYTEKMAALVEGWRKVWDREFPFYYVQIAPHLYHVVRPSWLTSPEAEPRFWEAQRAALRLPKTDMVLTTDLVDDLMDIHPRNKKDVALRLAALALAHDYGRSDLPIAGPVFQKLEVQGAQAILSFEHVEGGPVSRDGKPLTWFTICGKDGVYYPGLAEVKGEQIVVSSPRVPQPVAVRFGWDEGAMPNFTNKAGLPAMPFRTER